MKTPDMISDNIKKFERNQPFVRQTPCRTKHSGRELFICNSLKLKFNTEKTQNPCNPHYNRAGRGSFFAFAREDFWTQKILKFR